MEPSQTRDKVGRLRYVKLCQRRLNLPRGLGVLCSAAVPVSDYRSCLNWFCCLGACMRLCDCMYLQLKEKVAVMWGILEDNNNRTTCTWRCARACMVGEGNT